jgi:cytidylate kinase
MKSNVIAIDGPAAAGKSTIAGLVAEKLGSYYINTGNMYRAVTLIALEDGVDLANSNEDVFRKLSFKHRITYEKGSDGKPILTIDSKPANLGKIRSHEVAAKVSVPSKSLVVREWLVAEQRKMTKLGTIVMEGRDIGTNVFPNAKYKFYLTASPEVRAKRRLGQAGEVLESATVASVAKEIALRDEMDSKREVAPLKKAEDAVLVDSSNMTIDEVVNCIVSAVSEK